MKIRYQNTDYYWDTDVWELWSEQRKKYKKPETNNCGYLRYSLYIDGKPKHILQHRIIAELLIPNLDNKPCIDHINTDRTDNRLENLRWVTYKENQNNPLSKEKISKSNSKTLLQFDKEGNFIKEWRGLNEVEKEMGITHQHISYAINYKNGVDDNYIWKYKESVES